MQSRLLSFVSHRLREPSVAAAFRPSSVVSEPTVPGEVEVVELGSRVGLPSVANPKSHRQFLWLASAIEDGSQV